MNTWARYLVLDFEYVAPVDDDWAFVYKSSDSDSVLREEEQALADNSISVGQTDLKGKPKVYVYSGREMGKGSAGIDVLRSWITHCDKKHGCLQTMRYLL